MKRVLSIICVLTLLLSLCSCSKVNINSNSQVRLSYVYGDVEISQVLTDEEAATVISILDGATYSDMEAFSIPSCGFSSDIAFIIGLTHYGLANDSCGLILDYSNARYISISDADRTKLETIFEKHGGFFPCV